MTIYDQIAEKIIKEQELLMGAVAWQQARKVEGLRIDKKSGAVTVEKGKDSVVVIDNLVNRFGTLFGRAGREVCKDAVGALVADLKQNQVPSSLK
jgi:hypothetical protein